MDNRGTVIAEVKYFVVGVAQGLVSASELKSHYVRHYMITPEIVDLMGL